MEITIEMGCFKFPTDEMIPKHWSDHVYSLLSFMELVHQNVKGVVLDPDGQAIEGAQIEILNGGTGKNLSTTTLGEYWRVLAPGHYTVGFYFTKYLNKIFYFSFFVFHKKFHYIVIRYIFQLRVSHDHHEPHTFNVTIDVVNTTVHNVTLENGPCDTKGK